MMIRTRWVDEGVYVADEPFVHVGHPEMAFLRGKAQRHGRKQAELCTHKNPSDRLQERFVAYAHGAYVTVHKHANEAKAIHVVEGTADAVFFDSSGNVTHVIPLGTYASGRRVYCRIPAGVYFTLVVGSEFLVTHETAPGPNDAWQDSFAPWAPEEGDTRGAQQFLATIGAAVATCATPDLRKMIRVQSQSKGVHIAEEPIVHVGRPEIAFLRQGLHEAERNRIRLCAHTDGGQRLHEMFIVFPQNTYIQPGKHMGKEESIHLMEGRGEFVFFDAEGKVVEVVPVGDYSTGRRFYCRTPEAATHTVLIRSDICVVHETTQGPFRKADTVFAPWAPDDANPETVRAYRDQLEIDVEALPRSRAASAA